MQVVAGEHSVVSMAQPSLAALVQIEHHHWSRIRFPKDHALLAGERVGEVPSSSWPQMEPGQDAAVHLSGTIPGSNLCLYELRSQEHPSIPGRKQVDPRKYPLPLKQILSLGRIPCVLHV